MDTSPLEIYSSKERLVRQLLGARDDAPDALLVAGNERHSRAVLNRARKLSARVELQREVNKLEAVPAGDNLDPSSITGVRALQRLYDRQRKVHQIRASIHATDAALARTPIYGSDLRELLTIKTGKPYTCKSRRQPTVRSIQASFSNCSRDTASDLAVASMAGGGGGGGVHSMARQNRSDNPSVALS